jgi:O-acetyl-ADP-ribose deacetylase (regulator of RNase III)
MAIQVVQGDITKQKVDAIVNAANEDLRGGSGVCGAIFAAAGAAGLQIECNLHYPGGCSTGRAVVTSAQALAARGVSYIVHAVGPIWIKGADPKHQQHLTSQLRKAYLAACEVAYAAGARTIAFPCISTGVYGFPKIRAAHVAMQALAEYETAFDRIDVVLFPGDPENVLAYQGMTGTAVFEVDHDRFVVVHKGQTVAYATTRAQADAKAAEASKAAGAIAAAADDEPVATQAEDVEDVEDVDAEILDGEGDTDTDVTVEAAARPGKGSHQGQAALDL